MKTKRPKMSSIVALHYVKLTYRSLLFLAALIVYVYNRMHNTNTYFSGFENNRVFLSCIWLVFVVEMILRFFPSKMESMGCQKQFRKNYKPTDFSLGENERIVPQSGKSTFAVFAAWISLNSLTTVPYLLGWLDSGIMVLLSLAYSVCDIICILYFCPFQTWFLKNKCCGSCRIYNWDYAMMFTPLIFVPNFFAKTLFGIAFVLLIQWELLYHLHPERFTEKTNCSLSCAMCEEKLCQQKSQLRTFLKKHRKLIADRPVVQKIKKHIK